MVTLLLAFNLTDFNIRRYMIVLFFQTRITVYSAARDWAVSKHSCNPSLGQYTFAGKRYNLLLIIMSTVIKTLDFINTKLIYNFAETYAAICSEWITE